MDVLELLENLELENEKSCNDAFQFFMAEVIEKISYVTCLARKELIKDPPDPAPIIIALFKHRNVVSYLGKIGEFLPLGAFHNYADYANIRINDDEFIYGHTLLAYICAKLALRHHARGHGAKAAMYASEALACVEFIRYWLPRNDVYQDGLAKSKLARNAVMTKLANDPKQNAKQYVFSCWQVWQEEPERYKSKADFAKKMLKQEQCKSLTSQKKIEDWCRGWEKSNPIGASSI